MSSLARIKVGWVQVNNAVCPYVVRVSFSGFPQRVVPLLILQHAAQIDFHQRPSTFRATAQEDNILNNLCMQASLDFAFEEGIELMSLSDIHMYTRAKVYVSELAYSDPFGSAKPRNDSESQQMVLPTVVTDMLQQSTSSTVSSMDPMRAEGSDDERFLHPTASSLAAESHTSQVKQTSNNSLHCLYME